MKIEIFDCRSEIFRCRSEISPVRVRRGVRDVSSLEPYALHATPPLMATPDYTAVPHLSGVGDPQDTGHGQYNRSCIKLHLHFTHALDDCCIVHAGEAGETTDL